MSVPGNQRPDIAIHLYEPGDGGLDRVAIILANGFAQRGLRTELWLTKAEGPTAGLIAPDVHIRMLPNRHRTRGLSLALQLGHLRHVVRRVSPKVLLSAGNQSNFSVAYAARRSATAAIAKITNPVDRPQSKGLSLALRKRRFAAEAQAADLTLTLSEADCARYRRWFGPDAALAAVRNPYVTADMLALAAQRSAADTPLRLLSVGRLSDQKDHRTLLQALAFLRHQPWVLTLLGDGVLRPALAQLAADLDIADRVAFAGFGDALPHYATADICVLSSRWEGLPAVALEALAAGCDLVTTDCSPGLTKIICDAGLTAPTPVGNAEMLSKAIAESMARRRDPIALSRIAQPYAVDAAIDDHLRLFAPWLGA
ncbi:MAG: glycosyltransferase [Sphingopyxis sp.]|nr:glycosyltransferase [Sphingopyxis sp.]